MKDGNRITAEKVKMIESYLDGMSKKDAFCIAYPERAAELSDETLTRTITREFSRRTVLAEIERRKKARDEALRKEAEDSAQQIQMLSTLWTRKKHMNELIGLITWSNNMMEYANGDNAKISAGKLKKETLESIGKFLGYDAPIKIDTDSKVTVSFASGEDQTSPEDDWTG